MTKICEGQSTVGVRVEGVTIRFGDKTIVEDVSFEVKPGRIFVIMGPSGAGKSVLLKTVIGLLQPSEGRVMIGDCDASNPETHRRIRTSLVFQAGALFNSLSVFDNLAFYPREHRLAPESEIREKVSEALDLLSLGDAAEKFPSELSGGMRKRVAIARSLVMEPQLLLYDEPTSELDPTMGATISEIIARLRHELEVTSIVVSHDRDLARHIADELVILKGGRLIAQGTAEEVFAREEPEIRNFFHPTINIEKRRSNSSS